MSDSRQIRKDYHKLLQTRQWKEYSTERIERGDGCWNCAKRTDLQVHHLTYRDILPWEYDDEETRVLCRDCHKQIHLIADLIWVQLLRFTRDELETILKQVSGAADPEGYGDCLASQTKLQLLREIGFTVVGEKVTNDHLDRQLIGLTDGGKDAALQLLLEQFVAVTERRYLPVQQRREDH